MINSWKGPISFERKNSTVRAQTVIPKRKNKTKQQSKTKLLKKEEKKHI